MSQSKVACPNLDQTPSWPKIRMELSLLFAELIDDPKYIEQVILIGELLGDPHFPQSTERDFLPT
jgi:hypothetical protein